MRRILLLIVTLMLLSGLTLGLQINVTEPVDNKTSKETKEVSSVSGNKTTCVDKCGDGVCQEVVCMAVGCPCPETLKSCPQDCNQSQLKKRIGQVKQKIESHYKRINRTLENLPGQVREIHRHGFRVSNAVHSLLAMENLIGGIGEEVSQVARDINKSTEKTIEAEEKIKKRGWFIKIFFGGDEKAVETIQSEVNKNQQRLQKLEQLKQNCNCSEEVRAMMQEKIQEIGQEQERLQQVAQEEKQNKGLLGWLWK